MAPSSERKPRSRVNGSVDSVLAVNEADGPELRAGGNDRPSGEPRRRDRLELTPVGRPGVRDPFDLEPGEGASTATRSEKCSIVATTATFPVSRSISSVSSARPSTVPAGAEPRPDSVTSEMRSIPNTPPSTSTLTSGSVSEISTGSAKTSPSGSRRWAAGMGRPAKRPERSLTWTPVAESAVGSSSAPGGMESVSWPSSETISPPPGPTTTPEGESGLDPPTRRSRPGPPRAPGPAGPARRGSWSAGFRSCSTSSCRPR